MTRTQSLLIAMLFGVAGASCVAASEARAATTLLTNISGDGGAINYDILQNPNVGWYVENGETYHFKLGFKQGERLSPHPVEVATVRVDSSEEYLGRPSIALHINAPHEYKLGSTAYYKVSISSKQEKDHFKLPLFAGETFIHSFAMKIDPRSSIEDGAPVIFEQFWQGAPFAAPVSLIMFSVNDARGMHWSDVGPAGNFAIKLNDDDHEPLHRFPTKTEYVDLGPVVVGEWMTWQVHVTPCPSQAAGEVQVYRDGKKVADVTHHKVGFDPTNPEYADHRPPNQFRDVDVLLYRKNGDSFQLVYFNDVRLSIVK
jgi:hypothetical protein